MIALSTNIKPTDSNLAEKIHKISVSTIGIINSKGKFEADETETNFYCYNLNEALVLIPNLTVRDLVLIIRQIRVIEWQGIYEKSADSNNPTDARENIKLN
jgi:hypothetical protein